MSPLVRLRRAPWLAGAVLLLLVASVVVPAAARLGLRYWPFYAGAAAALLLLAGWLERVWRSRPVGPRLPSPSRPKRLRVVRGGKGNGHADDDDPDAENEEPRYLM